MRGAAEASGPEGSLPAPGLLDHQKSAEEGMGNVLSKVTGYEVTGYVQSKVTGYEVISVLIASSDYSLPQDRRRLYFIGFRKDALNVDPEKVHEIFTDLLEKSKMKPTNFKEFLVGVGVPLAVRSALPAELDNESTIKCTCGGKIPCKMHVCKCKKCSDNSSKCVWRNKHDRWLTLPTQKKTKNKYLSFLESSSWEPNVEDTPRLSDHRQACQSLEQRGHECTRAGHLDQVLDDDQRLSRARHLGSQPEH